ncbi:MAG: cobyrinic acid a,c-diamide synthase [Desulfovibrionales bacterium]|nr:cobyrinic acid a,c-diamide synthase [Desulfovibrionales bacterium]
MKGLVLAGSRSGCGKTSVSLGLMAALARRGLTVQPFKAGPDFIDPGLHRLAVSQGRTPPRFSHNLDSWMCSRQGVLDIFGRAAQGADVVLVEGVMGLFDGFSGRDETGSTAHLAKMLDLPVALILDASSKARSIAAEALGYLSLDPDLRFAGVVLNQAASPSHAELLQEAFERHLPDVKLLGMLPRRPEISLPSRHLGLVTAEDAADPEKAMSRLADWVEESLDIDALLNAAGPIRPAVSVDAPAPEPIVRLGVAQDQAFCFYYLENLRLLRNAGAELVPFSPLNGDLPDDLDGLYLGGGYPELHALALADNTSMRKGVRRFCASGRPVWAECGGFMYLLEAVVDGRGRRFPMAGAFKARAVMGDRLAALGYREATTLGPSCFGPAGAGARGHEFHYSRLEEVRGDYDPAFEIRDRKGKGAPPAGFVAGEVLGSYVHLHLASNPDIACAFVRSMARAAGR